MTEELKRGAHFSFSPKGERRLSSRAEVLISLALLAVPNIIAWVVLYPGFFQADHQYSMGLFIRGELDQGHSLVWCALAYPFIYLSPSYALYGLVQIAGFVTAVFFAIRKVKRVKVIKSMVPLSALFGLFPTFLAYNELYSSDICLAYALLYITALAIELVQTKGEAIRSLSFKLQLAGILALAICLRKNAPIVGVLLLLMIPFMGALQRRRECVSTIACGLALGLLIDLFIFPTVLHAKPSRSQEVLSVPATQIARVFAYEGDVPDEASSLLSIRSAEEWAEAYEPFIADFAKDGLNLSADFIKDWAIVGVHNPKAYLYAYLELEYPFWTFGYVPHAQTEVDFGEHDIFTEHSTKGEARPEYLAQFNGTEGKSWLWRELGNLPDVTMGLHIPLVTEICSALLFNRGLPLWTVAMGICLSKKGHRKEFLFVACPVLAIMLGFLMFAPVASMRYAMEAYYTLPLLWIYFARCTSRWQQA